MTRFSPEWSPTKSPVKKMSLKKLSPPKTVITNLPANLIREIAKRTSPRTMAAMRGTSKAQRGDISPKMIKLSRLENQLKAERRSLSRAMHDGFHLILKYNMKASTGRLTNDTKYHAMFDIIRDSMALPFGSYLKLAFKRFMKKYPGWDGSNHYNNISTDTKLNSVMFDIYKKVRNDALAKKYANDPRSKSLIKSMKLELGR